MVCNGEIYNHQKLKDEYEIKTNSNSDCEVILHLYNLIGFKKTIQLLDGVFAIILIDGDIVYSARDAIGVRSMYIGYSSGVYGFASELKCLHPLFDKIEQFKPGHIWCSKNKEYERYYDNSYKTRRIFPIANKNTSKYEKIKNDFYKKQILILLRDSVKKE
jgi:asparagine synthase (glutamine-hydrolysing)